MDEVTQEEIVEERKRWAPITGPLELQYLWKKDKESREHPFDPTPFGA